MKRNDVKLISLVAFSIALAAIVTIVALILSSRKKLCLIDFEDEDLDEMVDCCSSYNGSEGDELVRVK